MRNLAILPTLALLAFASAATDYQNAVECGRRFPRVNQAIEIFCSKRKDGLLTNDLVVPSDYANQGVDTTGLKGNKILVAIRGNCSPAQWIPYNWCNAQFHDLCANSVTGYNWVKHGSNDCQTFVIEKRTDASVTRGPRGPFIPTGIAFPNLRPKLKIKGFKGKGH